MHVCSSDPVQHTVRLCRTHPLQLFARGCFRHTIGLETPPAVTPVSNSCRPNSQAYLLSRKQSSSRQIKCPDPGPSQALALTYQISSTAGVSVNRFTTKAVALFQRLDGIDVCLFALYVQEYGSGPLGSNAGRAYISYLDSAGEVRMIA